MDILNFDKADESFFDGIGEEILEILKGYITAQSYTNSADENKSTEFLSGIFREIPYFKARKAREETEILSEMSEVPASTVPTPCWGCEKIEDDPFERSVFWALIRGESARTVVLLHHSDIVGIEDFNAQKDYAFMPDRLREVLMEIESLPPDARKDLEDGTFMFGRGSADMKGGGAIQIALMRRLSEIARSNAPIPGNADFAMIRSRLRAPGRKFCPPERSESSALPGNILMIAVPDEENLSAGMRTAIRLLARFKSEQGFDYRLMINSEPHQRKDFSRGLFSTGSVGKLMPFFYVRGTLAHIGKVYEGINPVGILSAIVRKTELNIAFSDVVGKEASPPPTWLYFRDGKEVYDVSMPLDASGCCSILTLGKPLAQLLAELRTVCESAADEVIESAAESYRKYLSITENESENAKLPERIIVSSFRELYDEAASAYGNTFESAFDEMLRALTDEIRRGEAAIERNFKLIEFIYTYIDDPCPRIVYGLLPPFYPAVSNLFAKDGASDAETLIRRLAVYSAEKLSIDYDTEHFYTGISDLSYAGFSPDETAKVDRMSAVRTALQESMPFFGNCYDIPTAEMAEIAMPVVNIGPWGKDFHKMTERVCLGDLCHHTPRLIMEALRLSLNAE